MLVDSPSANLIVYANQGRGIAQGCAENASLTTPPMHDISSQARRLVEEKAPFFQEQVRQAREQASNTRKHARLQVRLDTFADDPFVLYACLWLAYSEGVEVRLPAKSLARQQ